MCLNPQSTAAQREAVVKEVLALKGPELKCFTRRASINAVHD
jgi:hypothetical protein